MSNISNERLQEVIDGDILFTDEQRDLARELLALREAGKEPVAFINGAWTMVYYRPPQEMGLNIGDKLYAAPQVK